MRQITASEKKDRPGWWEAKGQDPATLKRRSYYAKSKAEAEDKAYASYGIFKTPETDVECLFGFYSVVYLQTIIKLSEGWKDQVAWAMDGYILPKFGHRRMDELTRAEFQTFFNGLPMKTSSKRRVKIVASCVFNLAEADEAITRNPVRLVRLPQDDKVDKTALTFEQLGLLVNNAKGLEIPVAILCACGLRIGEACAPSRADFQGNLFRLRYQILQNKGGCVRTSKLKTPQSERDIPIPKEVLLRLLDCGQVSGIYVASDRKGGYLTPNNAARLLAGLQERVGLGEYEDRRGKRVFIPLITPHEWRHTFISLLENELEAPDAIVASLAGRKHEGKNAGYSHTHRTQLEKWMIRFWDRVSTSGVAQTVAQEG